ncbi:FMN adenylyltransferase /riboflavin kinase [Geoalkalibacter ferrihydriticus]|uniref:Riboflavin biosynthesis protein n=2 Tax=Geoalkalibacter ferrihydriticus TaxID=392333 RepID=A0A0C2HIP1_9BACT|nr:bifunctional riboflavin kinase/FAD synthetase [Geoalkalibacter ferrihydriticus]KIH76916.1 riboflavin biosynthesis protein RibF [Geoalkalibacter ferrihydriticus DSM 17813]SDL44604.1 FMN adenylyltransferase /riboflavin kinase [Geoalkalibacter ferrihydriticus]
MKVFNDLSRITRPFPGAVVTLGNFDGVHLGHREIFRRVVCRAREIDGTAAVFSFWPHPLRVLAPHRELRLINTYDEKIKLIAASCIDVFLCPPFTRELADLRPEDFVSRVLLNCIGARHIVVGYDYRFGQGRSGDADLLKKMGQRFGFGVEILAPIAQGQTVYSSTRVRRMVGAGDVRGVVALLGRHFTLEGRVVHGDHRGQSLGFPTANLATEKELLPAPGVYAVKALHEGKVYAAVANIGRKPTFGGDALSIEVHLLDFSGNLYGRSLRLYFFDRLREEKRFAGTDELCTAIRADIARARELLANQNIIAYRDYLGECEDRDAGREERDA